MIAATHRPHHRPEPPGRPAARVVRAATRPTACTADPSRHPPGRRGRHDRANGHADRRDTPPGLSPLRRRPAIRASARQTTCPAGWCPATPPGRRAPPSAVCGGSRGRRLGACETWPSRSGLRRVPTLSWRASTEPRPPRGHGTSAIPGARHGPPVPARVPPRPLRRVPEFGRSSARRGGAGRCVLDHVRPPRVRWWLVWVVCSRLGN